MAIIVKYSSGSVKWVDVISPSPPEIEQLSKEYNLNQFVVFDCMQPEHLPKYEYDEDNEVHFLILRYFAHDAQNNVSSIQELTNKIAIFASNEVVITIHQSETPFLDPLVKRATKHNFDTAQLLSRIIWESLETFDDPANRLSDKLDSYESQIMLRKTVGDVTEALFYIKRQASIAHKVLMLMLEPINHIQVEPAAEVMLRDVRDQHLKIQTLYNQVLEDVNNLLNISVAFAAQRNSEVMRILTVFSVFFMPLTFIVGIYGMNFEFMPELKERWAYPAVLILMAIVAGFIFWWFRKKKWL
jgi:magnesium transporter